MTEVKTILFAPETFNLAETTRSIEVAKYCRDHFNCVFMGYSTRFSYLIEEAGFSFHYLKPHLTDRDIEQMMKADQMRTIRHPFTFQMVKKRVENEVSLVKSLDPAAVVIGTTLTLFISARACRTPLVYVKPFAYTRTHFMYGHLTMPRFLKKIVLSFTYKPKSFKKVATMYDVELPKYTIDALDADYNLITTIPDITGVSQLPDHYMYVGPIFAKLNAEIPEELKHLPENRPVIYFAMGSSGGKEMIAKILDILSHLDVTVICPMKKTLGDQANQFINYDNIYLCDLLPAHKISKYIDLSIIHGGEGTVQTACLTGKPFIGIGLQAEQVTNIHECVLFGNALQLTRRQINKTQIESMIKTALTSKDINLRATEMKTLLEDKNGAKDSANFLINKFGNE